MSSEESSLAARAARREYIDRNLAEARAGRDQLRDLADQEAPERDE